MVKCTGLYADPARNGSLDKLNVRRLVNLNWPPFQIGMSQRLLIFYIISFYQYLESRYDSIGVSIYDFGKNVGASRRPPLVISNLARKLSSSVIYIFIFEKLRGGGDSIYLLYNLSLYSVVLTKKLLVRGYARSFEVTLVERLKKV